MGLASPYQQYRQNAVQSAGPGELTLMLYNGLVKNLKLAMMSMERKDMGGVHNALTRSQEIVNYLNDTLDLRYDPAHNLSAIYGYMIRRLVEANVRKDGGIVSEVTGLAEELRDTWQTMVNSACGRR